MEAGAERPPTMAEAHLLATVEGEVAAAMAGAEEGKQNAISVLQPIDANKETKNPPSGDAPLKQNPAKVVVCEPEEPPTKVEEAPAAQDEHPTVTEGPNEKGENDKVAAVAAPQEEEAKADGVKDTELNEKKGEEETTSEGAGDEVADGNEGDKAATDVKVDGSPARSREREADVPEDWPSLVNHLLPVQWRRNKIRKKVETAIAKVEEEGDGREMTQAEEWLDIMVQDVSGRLGAVRRSRQRVQRAFKDDHVRSLTMPRDQVAREFTKESATCVLAAASATMLRDMDAGLEKESEALESWLNQLLAMRQMAPYRAT